MISDLTLCVTELVTNSVQHPAVRDGGDVEMSLRLTGGAVRVEVGDRGEGFDAGDLKHERGERGGWGLYIVELLADRWGIDRRDLNWVWFEIDLERAGAPR